MESCHVCGREAVMKAIIEGSEVYVCENCAHYGKPRSQRPIAERKTFAAKPQKQADKRKELVEGYGEAVREARVRLKMERKELANRLFVSESVLARIEDEALKPDERTAEKLEKALHVKLFESVADERQEDLQEKLEGLKKEKKRERGFTLADAVEIKVKKAE